MKKETDNEKPILIISERSSEDHRISEIANSAGISLIDLGLLTDRMSNLGLRAAEAAESLRLAINRLTLSSAIQELSVEIGRFTTSCPKGDSYHPTYGFQGALFRYDPKVMHDFISKVRSGVAITAIFHRKCWMHAKTFMNVPEGIEDEI